MNCDPNYMLINIACFSCT